MEELLQELGLSTYSGHQGQKNSYIVDLDTDLDFGKVYSILEDVEDAELLDDVFLLTEHNASVAYEYGNYQLTLKANFDTDEYSLVLMELKNETSNN